MKEWPKHQGGSPKIYKKYLHTVAVHPNDDARESNFSPRYNDQS